MQVLVQIDAWDPQAAGPVTLRASSHDEPSVCHAGGETWWPVLAKLPVLRYDLFDGAFGGQITAPSSTLTLQSEPWPNLGRYALADARIRVWADTVVDPAAEPRFDGRISGQPDLKDGAAAISFAADDRWLDQSLLSTYAGTTGAEGPAELKGQAKPLALGAPRYVSGKLIDSINSVFQVSAYGPLHAFEAALEKLARFADPLGDYATYDELVAADIPAGEWATATAVGMARFGAPPAGQISFLIQGEDDDEGWARQPGQLIRRIALLSGGAGKIDYDSLTALDQARPYNLSIYIDQQTTARQLIQAIAASVNAVAGVSWGGKLFVVPVGLGTPTVTLAADGSALPPVKSVEQLDQAAPFQKLAISAERAWTVHALADIAFEAPLVDLGDYSTDTTYREGNIVGLADGSRWLYIATDPSKGHNPEDGSTYWTLLSGPPVVDWSTQVGGAGKPADNATEGAPAGTDVAGVPAEDLVDNVENEAIQHLIAVGNAEIARLRTRGLSFAGPAGETSYVLIKRETTQRETVDTEFAETFDLLGAVKPDKSAFVLNTSSVFVGPDESMATRLDTIQATFEGHQASIDHIDEVLADESATIARALLRVTSDGHILGYDAYNDGSIGIFTFTADKFVIEDPDTGDQMFYVDEDGVKMHNVEVDTLKIGAVSGGSMSDDSMGKSGLYYSDTEVSVIGTDWITIATATITPAYGKPIKISFSSFCYSPDDASTPVIMQMIRDDGTPIYGGSAGFRSRVEDEGRGIQFTVIDGSVPDRATTYTVRAKKAGTGSEHANFGAIVLCAEELSRVYFDSFSVTAAAGTGPAAGITSVGGGAYNPNQRIN